MADCRNKKAIQSIARGPVFVSVLLTWALTYLAGILVWVGQFLFDYPSEFSAGVPPGIMRQDQMTRLLVGSLAVPMVETFLFQWLPIRLIRRTFKASISLAIGVSTLLFGAAHGYSFLYVAVALWGGFIFATVFVLRDYPGGRPFVVVAGAHAARNTLASIII